MTHVGKTLKCLICSKIITVKERKDGIEENRAIYLYKSPADGKISDPFRKIVLCSESCYEIGITKIDAETGIYCYGCDERVKIGKINCGREIKCHCCDIVNTEFYCSNNCCIKSCKKDAKESGGGFYCCVCHKELATPPKKCARCKMKYYCDPDCQKKDWLNGHKEECKKNTT